jgi:hypothetical protein
MIPALFVVWASKRRILKLSDAFRRRHHDHAAAVLQVRPRRARQIEDEVDLV